MADNLQKNRADAAVTMGDTPFLRAMVKAMFDDAGEQKIDHCELWEQGVYYGRTVEKVAAYHDAANHIDNGGNTKELREIARSIGPKLYDGPSKHVLAALVDDLLGIIDEHNQLATGHKPDEWGKWLKKARAMMAEFHAVSHGTTTHNAGIHRADEGRPVE